MDLGILIPLAPFLMVLGIVWIVKHSKLEEKRLAATASQTAEQAAQYSSRVAELEQRVQVLERIVTDRGYDIATQIEALRDKREVEERDTGVPLRMPNRENA
ncbi:hypothetical protein [Pelagerythrobacter aerophilus]